LDLHLYFETKIGRLSDYPSSSASTRKRPSKERISRSTTAARKVSIGWPILIPSFSAKKVGGSLISLREKEKRSSNISEKRRARSSSLKSKLWIRGILRCKQKALSLTLKNPRGRKRYVNTLTIYSEKFLALTSSAPTKFAR